MEHAKWDKSGGNILRSVKQLSFTWKTATACQSRYMHPFLVYPRVVKFFITHTHSSTPQPKLYFFRKSISDEFSSDLAEIKNKMLAPTEEPLSLDLALEESALKPKQLTALNEASTHSDIRLIPVRGVQCRLLSFFSFLIFFVQSYVSFFFFPLFYHDGAGKEALFWIANFARYNRNDQVLRGPGLWCR